MYKVDIYLAQSTASLSKDERWHGYVVACIKNGEEKTVNGFGHIFGTYHEATLRSLSDALDRLNQSCEVHIHTEDRFVLNMLGAQLEKWAGNNYLNAKGEPIKHAELWEEVYVRTRGQLIVAEEGRHSYSEWLDTEMKRRERLIHDTANNGIKMAKEEKC